MASLFERLKTSPLVSASFYTLTGHVLTLSLRLGGNLILTRLLAPAAFGLMSIVDSFIISLWLLTDVGVQTKLVQDRRAQDEAFANVGWTLSILRGVILLVLMSVAARPVATFYEEPLLAWIMPAVGVSGFLSGLLSTNRQILTKQLRVGLVITTDLVGQVVGLLVMIAIAYVYRSIWGLVLGAMTATFVTLVLSHTVLPGQRNRIHWDRRVAREYASFGIWVLLSSTAAIFLTRADRLVLGKWIDPTELGVYSIAVGLSQPVLLLAFQLNDRVLLPFFSEVLSGWPERFRAHVWKKRLGLQSLLLGGNAFFVVFGDQLITFLYDPRYADAGSFLRLLALDTQVRLILAVSSLPLLASGHSRLYFWYSAFQGGAVFGAMLLGVSYAGVDGLILGRIAASTATLAVVAVLLRRIRAWLPSVETAEILGSAVWIGLLFALRQVWLGGA